MRPAFRQIAGILAAFAIGLHTVLWGVVAAQAIGATADPFSVICHNETSTDNPASEAPGMPEGAPGHACDHCSLCSTAAAPVAPSGALAATLQPVLLTQAPPLLGTSLPNEVPVESTSARGPPVLG